MNSEKMQKMEKASGYSMLIIGLIFLIISVLLVLIIFLSGMQIPQLVPVPAGETNEFVKSMVIFSNVCLIFFIFIIIVWVGSIISSRGVTLIKDVKLKLVRKNIEEAEETVSKLRKSKS